MKPFRNFSSLLLVRICPAVAVAIAGMVVAGWALDMTIGKGVSVGWGTMKPKTVVALLLSGVALAFLLRQNLGRPTRLGIVGLGLGLILIGALSLGEGTSTGFLLLGLGVLALVGIRGGLAWSPDAEITASKATEEARYRTLSSTRRTASSSRTPTADTSTPIRACAECWGIPARN